VSIPILPLDEIKTFAKEHGIKLGIIAVPDIAAQQVLDMMTQAGIRGILNFAPIRLRGQDDTVIGHVNLVSELENVIYFMNTHKGAGEVLTD
jgi:redox-sensing transcriptional repressor